MPGSHYSSRNVTSFMLGGKSEGQEKRTHITLEIQQFFIDCMSLGFLRSVCPLSTTVGQQAASTCRQPGSCQVEDCHSSVQMDLRHGMKKGLESPQDLLPKFSLASTMQQMSSSQNRVPQYSMSFLLLQNWGNSQATGPNSKNC